MLGITRTHGASAASPRAALAPQTRLARFAVAGLLAWSLAACEGGGSITLEPVVLVDPAPDDPFDLDPLLAPRPLACEDCPERRIRLAGGDEVTIRATQAPPIRLASDQVEFLELASAVDTPSNTLSNAPPDDPFETAPEDARLGVFAVLAPAARAAWESFAADPAHRFVLVAIDGRPTDLIRPAGWSHGFRLAVFRDERSRAAFVESLEIPISNDADRTR